MRRNTGLDLTVDTDVVPHASYEKYEVSQSPSINARRSIDSQSSSSPTVKDAPAHDTTPRPSQPEQHPAQPSLPQPSIRLLFSLIPRRDFFSLVLPAISTSVIAGGIAPFMTLVVGQTFDAFANFPISESSSTPEQRAQLKHDVGLAAVELSGIGGRRPCSQQRHIRPLDFDGRTQRYALATQSI